MERCGYLNVMRLLGRVNLGLALFLLAICAFFLWLPLKKIPEPDEEFLRSAITNQSAHLDMDSLASGPLALPASEEAFPLMGLRGDILFLGINERPDANDEILLQLAGSKQRRAVGANDVVYLEMRSKKPTFSDDYQPISLSPRLVGDTLVVDVRLEVQELGVVKTASWTYVKPGKRARLAPTSVLAGAVESLKRVKLWGPDQLLRLYGGSAFDDQKSCMRIELDDVMHSIHAGDVLAWRDGKWQMPGVDMKIPIAQVVSVTDGQVEFMLWDEQGFDQVKLTLAVGRPAAPQLKMQDLVTRLRKRTHSTISCQIEGKPRVLRVGDWLLKGKGGWKVLRSLKEVDACIQGELVGELFVVDAIEKQASGSALQGNVFDAKRTQNTAVSIPFGGVSQVVKDKPKSRPHIPDFDDDDFYDDDDDDFLNSLMSGDDDD